MATANSSCPPGAQVLVLLPHSLSPSNFKDIQYPNDSAGAGTPVQNNMGELFGLLNLLDPRRYPGAADFFERFGGGPGQISTAEQIHALRVSQNPCVGS